jgi:hypothetical protein
MRPKEAVDQAYEKAVNRFHIEAGPIIENIVKEYEETMGYMIFESGIKEIQWLLRETTGYMIFEGHFEIASGNIMEDAEFSRED